MYSFNADEHIRSSEEQYKLLECLEMYSSSKFRVPPFGKYSFKTIFEIIKSGGRVDRSVSFPSKIVESRSDYKVYLYSKEITMENANIHYNGKTNELLVHGGLHYSATTGKVSSFYYKIIQLPKWINCSKISASIDARRLFICIPRVMKGYTSSTSLIHSVEVSGYPTGYTEKDAYNEKFFDLQNLNTEFYVNLQKSATSKRSSVRDTPGSISSGVEGKVPGKTEEEEEREEEEEEEEEEYYDDDNGRDFHNDTYSVSSGKSSWSYKSSTASISFSQK